MSGLCYTLAIFSPAQATVSTYYYTIIHMFSVLLIIMSVHFFCLLLFDATFGTFICLYHTRRLFFLFFGVITYRCAVGCSWFDTNIFFYPSYFCQHRHFSLSLRFFFLFSVPASTKTECEANERKNKHTHSIDSSTEKKAHRFR